MLYAIAIIAAVLTTLDPVNSFQVQDLHNQVVFKRPTKLSFSHGTPNLISIRRLNDETSKFGYRSLPLPWTLQTTKENNDEGKSSITPSLSRQKRSDTKKEEENEILENDMIPESINKLSRKKKRRKMELSWCGRDTCVFEDGLREKVVGEHNEISFESPATGQVAYKWDDDSTNGEVILSRVLMLVKRNDDDLLKVAADAVRELTSKGDIIIMLPPDMAAKFKHYFGVDNDKIELFEQKENFNVVSGYDDSDEENNLMLADGPDLVCTLGGDGLLMYAGNLFPGPCPPILCVAGGSLGFLTPFSRNEMVDAIRISLGLENDSNTHDDKFYYDGYGSQGYDWKGSSNGDDDSTPIAPPFITSPIKPPYVDEDGVTWTGSHRIPRDEVETRNKSVTFGANNQICMSTRMRLECLVINSEGVVRAKFNVLNEVVIDRGSSPYLAALECFCDNVHLTTVQADGIIFSTPTGSTAYSMAAGGSVVHPAVPSILVTPICPHVLSFRSMVFPDHVVLRCYVPEDARSEASVAFDGKYRRELHRGDSVQIQMSPYPVPTINRVDHSADWLTSLKRNFNFNTRARQGPL